MNAKKAKQLRREVRAEAKVRGHEFSEPGLLYRDTRKQIGWSFPPGWKRSNFVRLATVGGPWYTEAVKEAKRVYARQAVNAPGSFRSIYRKAKALLRGS